MKTIVKMILMFLLVVWLAVFARGERLGGLCDIYQPQSLVVSEGRVIVAQKSTFFVFALEDLKPIRQFCAEGEGPGELKSIPMIPNTIQKVDDHFVAEGMNKIIVYGVPEFKPLSEKGKGGMVWNFMPSGDRFLCSRFVPRGGDRVDIQLVMINGDLQAVKTLHTQETVDRDKEIIMMRDAIGFGVMDGRIYVEKSDLGFVIDVYEVDGSMVRRIEKDYTPLPLPAEYRRRIMETLRNDQLIRTIAEREGGWEAFKKKGTFTFPDYLPAIRDMKVRDGRIYVMVHTGKFEGAELRVLNTDGGVLKSRTVPFTPSPFFTANALGKNVRLWDVEGAYYYYLELDGDEEEWYLSRVVL